MMRTVIQIGGNAQTIIKDRWVHHTSFLWDFSPANMEYLQLPKKRPAYRKDRTHTQFLTPLKNKLPSVDHFEEEISRVLNMYFDVKKCDMNDYEQLKERLSRDHADFAPRSHVHILE